MSQQFKPGDRVEYVMTCKSWIPATVDCVSEYSGRVYIVLDGYTYKPRRRVLPSSIRLVASRKDLPHV